MTFSPRALAVHRPFGLFAVPAGLLVPAQVARRPALPFVHDDRATAAERVLRG